MKSLLNPGRVAGLWYLLLVLSGPLRLLYIPSKLIVSADPAATAHNIVAHAWLFRWGMVDEVAMAVILIFLVMAFWRLFEGVDRGLAALVVIFGGVMPATLHLTGTVTDAGAMLAAQGADFLSAFSPAQRDGLVMLFLKLHGWQYTSAETLWGVWLLPLAVLVYRSRFIPRVLGLWLALNGIAYVIISATGLLLPQYQGRVFSLATPALYGELAIMLWLVILGAKPPAAAAKA
ncbi:MAG: hypothetical protein JWP16_2202 [Alphaproteobacteria bacterium]|nr:hypothetical protein [Alphaproteobacteria bacterium]MDB5741162.1 hypothetical protein [Alphaproteobacteria bacterium]